MMRRQADDWHTRVHELSTEEMRARIAELDVLIQRGRVETVERAPQPRRRQSGANEIGMEHRHHHPHTRTAVERTTTPAKTSRRSSMKAQDIDDDYDILLGSLQNKFTVQKPRKNIPSDTTTATAATTTISNRSPPRFGRSGTDSRIHQRRSYHHQEEEEEDYIHPDDHHQYTQNELTGLKVTPLLERYKIERQKFEEIQKRTCKSLPASEYSHASSANSRASHR